MRGSKVKALNRLFESLYGQKPSKAIWEAQPQGGWEVKPSLRRLFRKLAQERREPIEREFFKPKRIIPEKVFKG